MNAERLLQHFDRIADAPDAIPRLRQFILDLAVRGKLVEQDPSDEPAPQLLERIQIYRAGLVKKGIVKNGKPLPPIGEAESPFDVPAYWVWLRLGDIGDWGSGSTPPRGNSEYYNGNMTWLKSGELEDRLGLKDSEERVSDIALRECSFRLNQVGDVLIAMYGATIGKLAILAEPAVTNQAVCACTPFEGVLNRYLFLYLLSRREDFRAQSEGGAQPNISKVKIVLSPFPLPPLAEQHRIVAKVDELTNLCDRLEAAQAGLGHRRTRLVTASLDRLNAPRDAATESSARDGFHEHARFYFNHLPRLTTRREHIKQLRQTILNLAVRGKLAPQNPNDESASELLKRIQEEREWLIKAGAIKRQQPQPPTKADEILTRVPYSWRWVRLSDLLLGNSQNGYSKKPDEAPDGIPILRISAGTIRRDGIVAEEEHKLVGGVSAAQQEQYRLQPGDLLACRFNGNLRFVGRLSLYMGYLGINPIYPDKLIRLRLLSQFVLPKLVRWFAESDVVRKDTESYCATTVGNWGISASNLKEVKIPLPPLPEQHRIVAKVDELMALCDQLEAQLTSSQIDSRRLIEAVLHEALHPLDEK
jgi:type I restriction enzyme, S subunit